MNIGELKELIKDMDNNIEIIISKDVEGNNYSPLSDYSEGIYLSSPTWYGKFYHVDELNDPDEYNLEEVENIKSEGSECICLWPIN